MKKKIKVGIIGGGQLGMMLAEASSKLNIVPLYIQILKILLQQRSQKHTTVILMMIKK